MLPTLVLSHGSPTLPFDDVPARAFLTGLAASLPRPDAIVIASAHWETDVPTVNAVATNATIYDFYGFPEALYRLTYPAPGAPALAERIADMLGAAGLRSRIDQMRGLDHGAWVPAMLIWPDPALPVLQLSIQSRLGPGHHVQLGQALAELRRQNVLVIGSGSFTHNLRALVRHGAAAEPPWVTAFADWMHEALIAGRTCDLVSYRAKAPYAQENHPTDEHLLPLYVALGAAGQQARATRIHSSTTLGSLRMDAYAFD